MNQKEDPLLLDIKWCTECGSVLTDNNWQPSRKLRNHNRCSSCCNKRTQEWKNKNREKVIAYKREWSKNNRDKYKLYRKEVSPEASRKYIIKVTYNITWDEYVSLYNEFGGKCGICGEELSLLKTKDTMTAHIDHCHTTNKVRGILCRSCNRGIGYLRDDPELLTKASDYLKERR